MSDNEIIKALEACFSEDFGKCDICPFEKQRDEVFTCIKTKQKNAIDLINRQKAQIELLQKTKQLNEAEIERLQKTIVDLNANLSEAVNCFTRMETLYKIKCKELEVAKSEARKEFAERLKSNVDGDINRVYAMGGIGGMVGPLCKFKDDIDNLLKEMEGADK